MVKILPLGSPHFLTHMGRSDKKFMVDHCIQNLHPIIQDIQKWAEYLGQIKYSRI